jgi:hypothetical protein
MAQYAVYMFCNECGGLHSVGVSVSLDKGPSTKESVGNLYRGQELPPEIAKCRDNWTICPNTRDWVSQKIDDLVFLVPINQ